MKKLLALAVMTAAAFAAEGFHVIGKDKIGGTGGWDYVTFDPATNRLFVSHANEVDVLDASSGNVVGKIADTPGVHGVAIVHEFNRGFISSRGKSAAIIFDLKTLEKIGEAKAGNNPDAVCYEPKTKRVFAINHSGGDATAIDAKTGNPIATFPVGEAPEFCQADGAGHIYVNVEGSSEVVEIDAAKPAVSRRASLAPCDGPSGLAIDTKDKVLFSVCGNKMMAITDYSAMKLIGTAAIGSGPDAAAYDPGLTLAFSSNGESGNLTLVKKVNGKWEAVDTVETERGARTMALDEKTHRIFLPAAEYGPSTGKGRPPVLPDTFHLLVVGK